MTMDKTSVLCKDLGRKTFADLNIHPRFTSREHSSNGGPESSVRDSHKGARILMVSALKSASYHAPPKFVLKAWPYALQWKEFLHMIAQPEDGSDSMFKILFKQDWPKERCLPIWCSKGIYHVKDDQRTKSEGKLALAGCVGYFLGYELSGKGVFVLNAETGNCHLAYSYIPCEFLDDPNDLEHACQMEPADFDDAVVSYGFNKLLNNGKMMYEEDAVDLEPEPEVQLMAHQQQLYRYE